MKLLKKELTGSILTLMLMLAGGLINGQTTIELNNDTLHLKLDLTRGGAINYISVSGTTRNIVNIHDEGRYVQQSYYAGESLNRIADGQSPSWSPWAWNPIQVGDAYNNRAEILEQGITGNTAYTRCIPMLWDMNNEPAEAIMEQWTTLMGNVVKVHNKLTCTRTDTLWGEGQTRDQELPAVYPISALKNLYSYFGPFPFTGAPLDHPPVVNLASGFWGRYQNEMVTENWMAFVDDNQWGMAVYTPICDNFLAGMAGSPGGESMDGSTSYIAPVKKEKMYKNTVYEYDYYLVVGTLNQIRSEIYALRGVQENTWEFTDDLEGWNVGVTGGSVEQSAGNLNFNVTGDHSSVSKKLPSWEAGDLKFLWMEIKNETAGDTGAFSFFFENGDSASLFFELLPNDYEFRHVLIDLDTLGFWTGTTPFQRFSLEPVISNDPGIVSVNFIRFLESLIQVRTEGGILEIKGLGNSLQLYAEEIPALSSIEVDWTVDDPGIAGVNASGLLTAVSDGVVTVTANAIDGSGHSGSITVNMIDDGQKTSWEFVNDVEGWDKNLHACIVSQSEEALIVTVEDEDPYVSNNVAPWLVGDLKYLWIRVRNETAGKGGALYLFPSGGGHDFVSFPLTPEDDLYRDVFVDMRNAEKWNKNLVINDLRLDANNGGEPGEIYFDFIRFREELVSVTSEGGVTEIEGIGNTLQLYADALVTDEPLEFQWSVDKPGVATVDHSGILTSVTEGVVVVTASDKNGKGIAGDIKIAVKLDHTAINQSNSTELRFYPNPAGSFLRLGNASDIHTVTILNISGQVVMEVSIAESQRSIDIGSLKPGIFILRETSIDGKTTTFTFVKN